MTRDETILSFLPTAKLLARKMRSRCAGQLDLDDLYSEACVGLIQAVDSYREGSQASLKTWVRIRIWGCMLDYLRSLDALSRSERKRVGNGFQATQQIPCFVHEGVEIDLSQLIPDTDPDPEYQAIRAELVEACLDPTRSSSRHAFVLSSHFLGENTVAEVGETLAVSQGRVSQLISEAGRKIRASLSMPAAA